MRSKRENKNKNEQSKKKKKKTSAVGLLFLAESGWHEHGACIYPTNEEAMQIASMTIFHVKITRKKKS